MSALGFLVERAGALSVADRPAAIFVSLDDVDGCAACRPVTQEGAAHARPVRGPGLLVGYGTSPDDVLAVHRLHRCTDVVLALRAVSGRPRFVQVAPGDRASSAGVTAREADVLVLLYAGFTTVAIAGRLGVSANTARSHCRSVLRKLGACDRRDLLARHLAGAGRFPSPEHARVGRFAQPRARTLPSNEL